MIKKLANDSAPYKIVATLNSLIDLVQKEEEWPKDGDVYWIINDCGDVAESCWDNYKGDIYRKNMGNIYRTESEAKKALEEIKRKFLNF